MSAVATRQREVTVAMATGWGGGSGGGGGNTGPPVGTGQRTEGGGMAAGEGGPGRQERSRGELQKLLIKTGGKKENQNKNTALFLAQCELFLFLEVLTG